MKDSAMKTQAVLCLLLCATAVLGNESSFGRHEVSQKLVDQMMQGTNLDDASMADLTDSIQSLFDVDTPAPAKTPASPPPPSAVKTEAKVLKTAAPPPAEKPKSSPKPVSAPVKVVSKPVAPTVVKAVVKPTQAEAVKPLAKVTKVEAQPEVAKVVPTAAKPKAAEAVAKVVQPKVVQAVAKPAEKKVVENAVKPKQVEANHPKVAAAKASLAKVTQTVTKPSVAKVQKLWATVATEIKKPVEHTVEIVKPAQPTVATVQKPSVEKVQKLWAKVATEVIKPVEPKVETAKPTQPVVATLQKPSVAKVQKLWAKVATEIKKPVEHTVEIVKPAQPTVATVQKPSVAKVQKLWAKVATEIKKPVEHTVEIVKSAQPTVAKVAANPSQPKVEKAKPTQPKVAKLAAKPSQPKVEIAKPAVAKVVTKPVQPKVAKVVAKLVQSKVATVAAKPEEPNVAKVATKPVQPKVAKVTAKPVQPKVASFLAKAKPTQPKVAKPVAVQPVVAKVVAKPVAVQPKVAKVVAKPSQPKVEKVTAKPPQPKVAMVIAKPSQPKVAKLATPAQPTKQVKESQTPVKAPAAKVAKVIKIEKSMKKPLAKVQVAAKPLSQVHVAKLVANASESLSVNHTNTNQTKAIEEAVVSLPMASFALDIVTPVVNVTKIPEKKFPGSASQKLAWEKKEQALEREVATLKVRLAKVNSTPAKLVTPAAAGTFNSHLGVNNDVKKEVVAKSATNLAESKRVAPMEPIRKEKIPKATWPTMQSVAAPVALHNVHSAVAPPQKEAVQAQQGKSTPVAMGTTFTGTPAKKVESVMALDSKITHDAVVTDAVHKDVTPAPASWWHPVSWVSSFFGRVFGRQSVATVPEKAPKVHAAALLDTTQRGFHQDMERTAQATQDEGAHVVALNSVWGQMEQEDRTEEDRVRSEDESERQRAMTREAPRTPTKAELKGRHGAEMSSFWGQLEEVDSDLQKSVESEDLGEYHRLTEVQDWLMTKANKQMKDSELHVDRKEALHNNDRAFLYKTIHDTWEDKEKQDKAVELKIHDSPDLQMLQMKRSLRPLRN